MSRVELAEYVFQIVALLLLVPVAFRYWSTWYMVLLLGVLGVVVWISVRRVQRMRAALREAEEQKDSSVPPFSDLFGKK